MGGSLLESNALLSLVLQCLLSEDACRRRRRKARKLVHYVLHTICGSWRNVLPPIVRADVLHVALRLLPGCVRVG